MSNSCCIFFYEGYVGVAPTIINLCQSLNNQGYSVTVYGTDNPFPKLEKIGDKTNIIYFRKLYDIPIVLKILLILKYKFNLKNINQIVDFIFFACPCLFHQLANQNFRLLKSKVNIGVDTNGSLLALIKYYIFKQKFIYLSLELNHPDGFIGCAKIINILERLAYKKSEFVIVQDEDRFNTLCKYNQYQHPKVFYLPNSPTLSSNALGENIKIENYFRTVFNLNKNQFTSIILQAGMIQDAVFSKELAQAFLSINNGYALVFHDREAREIDDPYIMELQAINSKNLFLSLKPLPYEQIEKIYASATIGLAFYRQLDNNFSQISMASGKISHYLKYGVPLLVNNLESLSNLVDKYKVGITIKDPSNSIEIESAIEDLLKNYDSYSKNAKDCFQQEFDFSKKVKPILSFMENL